MNSTRTFTDVMAEVQAAASVQIKDQSRAGLPYSAKEDGLVAAAFAFGTPVLAIAVLVKRTPGGIAARLSCLGLVTSPSCTAAAVSVKIDAPQPHKTVAAPEGDEEHRLDRNETIARVRKALKLRSGKNWSVTGGRGTAWGWITITAQPKDCVNGYMSDEQRAQLQTLLGLDGVRTISRQGHNVAASGDYYREIVDRAEGREPRVIGRPYWD